MQTVASRHAAPGWLTALVLVGAAGCSTTPEPVEPPSRGETAALVDPWLAPDAGLVTAFKARFEALAGAPACQAALVRDEPEHAHALFLESQDDGLRQALADAFARQARPDTAYTESERARRTAPDVHARAREAFARALALRTADESEAADQVDDATMEFRQVGDPLWTAEATLLGFSIQPHTVAPDGASAVQQVQAAVLFAHEAGPSQRVQAVETARRVGHAAALERLEALRAEGQAPPTWVRTLCQAALERRLPLVALRHAATLTGGGAGDVPAADRLLLARAHQLAAQTEPALAQAIQAADDAKAASDQRTQASARALVAELLLDLGRPDAAVDEFAAAEALFLEAGDPEGRLRQAVNRAGVLVRLKRLDEAEAALTPVQGLSLPGEQGADLACRRGVTAALLALVAGRAGVDEAVKRVEEALAIARAAGAYHAVERYVDLPKRLRPGPG